MNSVIKAIWVEALLSGEYKQGTNYLKDGDKFCCLGVLCDLHSKTALKRAEWEPDCTGGSTYLGDDVGLPEIVEDWAGFSEEDCPLDIDGRSGAASHHNDNGCTFKEIAKAIQEQL